MSSAFLTNIQKNLRTPVFTDEDLRLLFYDRPEYQIYNSISYHLKEKNLIRYKRGIYSLASLDGKFHFPKFALANSLYAPSYVSFESALSYYSLIPEGVYECTSACFLAKKKKYTTAYGIFSFSYSPLETFFLDVRREEKDHYLIASPLRALFDLIYRRKVIYLSLDGLEKDLRIDLEELDDYLAPYTCDELVDLGRAYKKKSTRALACLLIERRR